MTIELIANPKTEKYQQLKNTILGQFFPWSWGENTITTDWKSPDYVHDSALNGHEDFGFYSHGFLMRPVKNSDVTCCYPTESSPFVKDAHDLVTEILDFNNVKYDLIFRMAANCVHPTETRLASPPHEDHPWPHTNLLIYLTDPFKGETVVEEKKFFGKEDDVILFQGVHYHRPPEKNRRIVFVATFI